MKNSKVLRKMKKLHWHSIIILVLFYVSGCSPRIHHNDSFYNYSGDFDYLRFPLIKPYYMDFMDDDYDWGLGLYGFEAPSPNDNWTYSVIYGISKLSVVDGVIMAYSPYVSNRADENIRENFLHWFVIVPDERIEIGFETEGEFLDYIHRLGLQQPEWLNPFDVFKEFEQTGCLEWMPDCD